MKAIGIKNLKNKLSEYVKLAASGEVVLVTDRDQVVAELGPPHPDRSPTVHDALLADSIRKGLVRPPVNRHAPLPARHPVMPLRKMLEELDHAREDR